MTTLAAPALALFLCVTSVAHFAFPVYFRSLVPDWLPHPAAFVVGSALAELALAALLLEPSARGVGGWSAAALFTAFQTAHLDAVRHVRTRPGVLCSGWGVGARLLVNAVYVAWAVVVATAA